MAGEYNSLATEIVETGLEAAIQGFGQELEPGALEVRQAAADLVLYARQLKGDENILNQLGKKVDTPMKVARFTSKYVQNEQQYQELMRRMFTFQNLANEFLGQQVIMTFVDIDYDAASGKAQVKLYEMDNTVEHLRLDKASSSHGGGFTSRYNRNALNLQEKYLIAVSSSYNTSDLESTFSEVYSRYIISKEKIKMKGAAYILWHFGTIWDGAWISGAGPLGEAYVNMLINEVKFPSEIEHKVKFYVTDSTYGATAADNASGLLQGDVSKDGKQYGVKINQATAMGYSDVIKYATQLLNYSNTRDYLESLREILEKKAKHNMVKYEEGKIDRAVVDTLKPLYELKANGVSVKEIIKN